MLNAHSHSHSHSHSRSHSHSHSQSVPYRQAAHPLRMRDNKNLQVQCNISPTRPRAFTRLGARWLAVTCRPASRYLLLSTASVLISAMSSTLSVVIHTSSYWVHIGLQLPSAAKRRRTPSSPSSIFFRFALAFSVPPSLKSALAEP